MNQQRDFVPPAPFEHEPTVDLTLQQFYGYLVSALTAGIPITITENANAGNLTFGFNFQSLNEFTGNDLKTASVILEKPDGSLGKAISTAFGQENPLNVVRFAGASSDTADNIEPSEFGLYNGSTQVQSGSFQQVNRIYIARYNSEITADPTQPTTNLSAVDGYRFFQDIIDNGGAVYLNIQQASTSRYVHAIGTLSTHPGGYLLTVTHLYVPQTINIAGNNDTWRVVATMDINSLSDNIIDLAERYVQKSELAGKESDRYASYNNAFVQNSYRRGDWVLTTDTSGPPTEGNQVRQPDIATGSGLGMFQCATANGCRS